jgi:serine/threonine protein kinase/tetratricopeptide (TPR) repeat protein
MNDRVPSPSPCPAEESLILLASGAIEDRAMLAHVSVCEACRAMMASLDDDAAFLEDLRRDRGAAAPDAARPSNDNAAAGASPIAGYRILGEISRGGQGVVHRAVEESTGRTVAIKTLHSGAFATSRARARFEREIEIASSLRHPNIVTVYHATRIGDGEMGVVMEFVEGSLLDAWAHGARDGESPGAWSRRAASVMRSVCRAVGYAHRRGVIHRDLKPANIIVDAADEGHVLDFGVARRVARGATVTFTGEFTGTLAYAAPEQVSRASSDEFEGVDVRTDVYALGVILYELLAGEMPYAVDGSLASAIRSITESDPAPLRRGARSGTMADLETIVLKALSKNPERRYASAEALGDDLELALAGRAINARRDSVWYVIRKSAGRHKRTLLAAAAGLALVIGGAVSLASGQSRASAARHRERMESVRADGEATQARAVSYVMSRVVPLGERLDILPGQTPVLALRERLSAIEGQLEFGAFAHDPRFELALRTTIAALYAESVAMSGRGEVNARQAVLARSRLHGPDHPQTAAGHLELARVLLGRMRPKEAATECERALAILSARLDDADPRLLEARVMLARVLVELGEPARALDRLAAASDAVGTLPPWLAVRTLAVRARALGASGRGEEAIESAGAALRLACAELGDDDADLALAIEVRGRLLAPRGGEIDPLDEPEPISGPWLIRVGNELTDAAPAPRPRSATLRDLAALRAETVGEDHRSVGFTLAALGWQLMNELAWRDAAGALERAALYLEREFGPLSLALASCLDKLGAARTACADFDGAVGPFRRSLEIWLALPDSMQNRVTVAVQHRYVAHALILAGRPGEAETLAREGIHRLSTELGVDHYAVGKARCVLAWALCDLGRTGEGLEEARAGYALVRDSAASPPDQREHARVILGLALERAGRADEAIEPLRTGLETLLSWNFFDDRLGPFQASLERACAATGRTMPDQRRAGTPITGIR